MLPIITVGLTAASLAVVERISGDRGCAHYDTAEEALWDLPTDNNPTVAGIDLAADGEHWTCHVIYGDDALGALLTHTELDPRPTRIPCNGLVTVITDSLGDDQLAPRRVIDGTPESRAITRSAVEAVQLLRAQAFLIVDQLDMAGDWRASMGYAFNRAEELTAMTGPLLLDRNPGADAARALGVLAERTQRGLPRSRGEGL
jgi:hypothetical protein